MEALSNMCFAPRPLTGPLMTIRLEADDDANLQAMDDWISANHLACQVKATRDQTDMVLYYEYAFELPYLTALIADGLTLLDLRY